jgi:acyl-CoA thioesterase
MTERVFEALRRMVEIEPFAREMGFRVTVLDEGFARVEMNFTDRMKNIHGTAHGGAIFSLMDEAFELASNSHGTIAVALNVNISFLAPPKQGLLAAEAKEISLTGRTANYQLSLLDPSGKLLATGQGMVYRKKDKLPFL